MAFIIIIHTLTISLGDLYLYNNEAKLINYKQSLKQYKYCLDFWRYIPSMYTIISIPKHFVIYYESILKIMKGGAILKRQ